MKNSRPILIAAGTLAALAAPMPAYAQNGPEAVLRTIVICSELEDLSARLACYDGTAMQARRALGDTAPQQMSAAPSPNPAPLSSGATTSPAPPAPSAPSAPPATAATARDRFGAQSMPREAEPARQQREEELSSISASVASTRQMQPGIYEIVLDDGTSWQFTESVPSRFFPPRRGDSVTVERAALGSFRMLMDGKAPVRVRRTR